ncbi:hypothetical protein [Nannocystis punicea]|uniref:HEAT repeat protein n=1 Tax=Nannocystis punicea TaxID=2995304 RepID=A0ABY7H712_9BACT|nr:hypothetical protein [Nannocystis poenicansa]WAS95068.1 hypothetical protein O0S08_02810 [Nannocystis poenicansa]
MTNDGSAQPPTTLLRRALERAGREAISRQLPAELPPLLIDEGIWSPAEALEAIDFDDPRSVAALAPRLSREQALTALARAETILAGDHFRGSFGRVVGVVALLGRLLDLDATQEVFDALTRLPQNARGLVVARVAERLPADLRADAVSRGLADFDLSGDEDACIARLLFARLVPERRKALINDALFALGEFPVEPLHLQWVARSGAVARAIELVDAEDGPSERAQALAAVIPWCRGAQRAEAWATWREETAERLAAGRSIPHLPLPADPDERPELATLARGLATPYRRAVALTHLAAHHHEFLDEALAAVRQLGDDLVVDRLLGLASLLPALAGAGRHDAAREAWTILAAPDIDRESISDCFDAWPPPVDEPQLDSSPGSPTPARLRARIAVHLAPDERRSAALGLLAAALRIDDTHYRAAAIAALGAHLPDPDARARVLARAESLALASSRPSIALGYLLEHVDPERRPQLARRALALLPDEIDGELMHDLPPLLAALPPDDAGALVARAVAGPWSFVNHVRAIVAAALQAGAVRPLAELFLGDSDEGRRAAEYVLPLLLQYADAELHPRISAVLLEDFEDSHMFDFPDILEAVPWLSPAEQKWLVERIPRKRMYTKLGNRREPVIVALARPLAEQGAFDLLRPLLQGAGRPHRLAAFAHALPFLAAEERERVTRQLFGDLRRGTYGGWRCVPALAAAGLGDALLDVLPPTDIDDLARIAPQLSPEGQSRLLERISRRVADDPGFCLHSHSLRPLGPLLRELPRDVLAHLCERALADAGRSGRPDLLRALAVEQPYDRDYEDVEPGLTRALVELAGPDLPACIALLDDLDRAPTS